MASRAGQRLPAKAKREARAPQELVGSQGFQAVPEDQRRVEVGGQSPRAFGHQAGGQSASDGLGLPNEPLSKLLVSSLISPIVVPYITPEKPPCKEFRL